LRELGEQRCQLRSVVRQVEPGGEVPAGDVDVRARLPQLGDHSRQRFGAVDEHVDRVPFARRGVARGPEPVAPRLERTFPAELPQPPPVMTTHEPFYDVAHRLVERKHRIRHRHTLAVFAQAPTPLISLDPGHGTPPAIGRQTEPIGPGSRVLKIKDGGGAPGEARVALAIGLKTRTLLRRAGYRVAMTRTGPTTTLGNIA